MPIAHGNAYPNAKGPTPSAVPHAIQRSCRRPVSDVISLKARVRTTTAAAAQRKR
jgi:hypothetical protein